MQSISFTSKVSATLLVVMALLFGALFVTPVEAQSAQARLCTGAGGVFENGECRTEDGSDLFNSDPDSPSIFQRVADTLLFITGAVSVVMLIIGGLRYVISSGDQQAVASAKDTILYAIIGLVVTFLAFAAVRFVVNALEGNPDGDAAFVQQIDEIT